MGKGPNRRVVWENFAWLFRTTGPTKGGTGSRAVTFESLLQRGVKFTLGCLPYRTRPHLGNMIGQNTALVRVQVMPYRTRTIQFPRQIAKFIVTDHSEPLTVKIVINVSPVDLISFL